jgi:eukaryotic-like serine/threonine-protein kinase
MLSLFSLQNNTAHWLDAQMFRFSSYLLQSPVESNNIRVIQIDEARLQTPQGVKELRGVLRKLGKSKAAEIVWLTDDFPKMDFIENVNAHKNKTQKNKKQKKARQKNKKSEKNNQHWKPTKGERNKLAWMLEKKKIILTQYSMMPLHTKNMSYSDLLSYQTGWRQYIPDLFLPEFKTVRLTQSDLPYQVYPFDYQTVGKTSLIWYAPDQQFSMPDLSLAVFSQFNKKSSISWSDSGEIRLGETRINTGLSGEVYNYYSELTKRHSRIKTLSFSAAEKKSKTYFKNKIVLIGYDARQLQVLVDSISSIDAGAIYFTPAYGWWLLPLIMLMLVFYLIWLLPLLSKQSGVFLGAFIVLSLITAQHLFLMVNAAWWPIVNVLQLLLLGQISVYVYLSGEKILNDISKRQYDAWFQLGHYQYEKGDYETAITSLLKCSVNDEVLSDLYEIGLSFERKRQYDRALQIYSEINVRHKKYKDIDKRLKSLSGFSETRTTILTPAQAQKTLVMPEMEMPEFGRYKIEKELGRGAMGVVYLGNDPKINRKVAIKTLDYTQFSKTELKTVKSRFFREAEAAGRLSHNNIVTVYDVGEEPDFAFIAMDYVEGVALSDFTQENNLLAVREVYRILQVVAETLGYAHDQNIVHRDIKPGNIMYNPENQQIKITDFGIARITDSVKTRTGSFMGSPSYMAPEQMTGSHVDGQADLYSLGVSMYQLLTGRLPYDADSLGNLAYKITNEKHRPIRELRADLPASATRITNKAMQKKTDKRYADGTEMAMALNKGMPLA